jgi:DNA-binding NarL/FixJ family response regulator
VDFARNGEEAIALYQERAYDVVMLDLTIPGGMGGKETIKELLKIDPNVKAIVSSGYSSDPIMGEYQQYGFKDVIAKPYGIEELGEVIHCVIAKD